MRTFVIATSLIINTLLSIPVNKLTVKISDIKKTKGELYIAIYNSETSYMFPDSAYRKEKVPAIEPEVIIVFDSVDPGEYAIVIFHDKNENGDLDKLANGIPKEDYGFSNNVKGRRGPPSYTDSKFTFEGDKTIEIRLFNNIFD